jgi:iron(III) transport system ATP-binding protein
MLKINKLSFSYGKKILSEISFELIKGEVIGVIGQSGTGKSTLLKLIAGLIDPAEGAIYLEGKLVLGPAYNLLPGHPEIQLVNQDFALDLYHTVEENIREKILYLAKKERDDFVLELLELVELKGLVNQQALNLSGGEQQRLALARALAMEPKIILLDEPFAHSDSRLKLKLSNYLMHLKKIRKTSIILVTHDGTEVLSLADRIIYIDKGEVKRIASPFEFYYQPEHTVEAAFFGTINRVEISGKKIFFRPNEYVLNEDDGIKLELKFIDSQFLGAYYLNHFITNQKEAITLLNFESLNHVKRISIRKKIT